jgi:hypothetical protein
MKNIILGFILLWSLSGFGQKNISSKTVVIKGVSIINPKAKPTSFAPLLKNLEAPNPGGKGYKQFLNRQKTKSYKLPNSRQSESQSIQYGDAPNPVILDSMKMRKYIAQIDLEDIYNGGTPLDNTMALSQDYLLASVNSFLWAYDVTGDSNLFVDEFGSTYNISFAEFGKDYIVNPNVEFPFDPKLLYIPEHDRFIFLFLSGRQPTDSKIIVGFSSTNDPRDPWNVYMIPGNPRNLDQWSDFPMIGYDNDNFYLSLNMLKANTSWQLGFKGSIVWQVPMDEGFDGDSTLNTVLYDDITHGGNNIRNLTPVQASTNSLAKENGLTFLSNRNFDIQNDSLFVIEINRDKTNKDVYMLSLPINYGVPPNGIQADDDPNDQTDGLQTNDARFLAAISYLNSSNQKCYEFVGNTKDFGTSRSGIYHGKMIQKTSLKEDPQITANIISVDSLDFGYPNITYVNNGRGCYEGSLIAFNHTSATEFAGVSAIRHSFVDGYSDIIRLKSGDNYVRRLTGSYERWGDYFGMQTLPNDPSQVYTAGFYGTNKKSASTWFTHLAVSDTNVMTNSVIVNKGNYFNCYSEVSIATQNGFEPYKYQWSNGTTASHGIINFCDGYNVTITDSKNCTSTFSKEPVDIKNNDLIYPNPVTDRMTIGFHILKNTVGSFGIYDLSGSLVVNLGNQNILKGKNEFSFSALPLQKGAYVLIIKNLDDEIIIQKPFVKL